MTQRAVNNAIVLYELGITSEELQTAREITEKVPALLNVLQTVSYTHLRAHETDSYLVCRLLLEKKKNKKKYKKKRDDKV